MIGIDDLAEFLGIPKATIYDWRKLGRGPVAHRLGKHLRWRMSDVEAWLEERRDVRKEEYGIDQAKGIRVDRPVERAGWASGPAHVPDPGPS